MNDVGKALKVFGWSKGYDAGEWEWLRSKGIFGETGSTKNNHKYGPDYSSTTVQGTPLTNVFISPEYVNRSQTTFTDHTDSTLYYKY